MEDKKQAEYSNSYKCWDINTKHEARHKKLRKRLLNTKSVREHNKKILKDIDNY